MHFCPEARAPPAIFTRARASRDARAGERDGARHFARRERARHGESACGGTVVLQTRARRLESDSAERELKEATGQDDDQDGDDDGGIRAHEIHGFVGAIGGDRGAGADGDAEEE